MKLLFENWRKYLNEEKIDPRMKKYLKDHPYMEPDGLQEDQLEETSAGSDLAKSIEYTAFFLDPQHEGTNKLKNMVPNTEIYLLPMMIMAEDIKMYNLV